MGVVLIMFHLTIRVPWHDNNWNGKICEQPENNSFCTSLKRIRENKHDGELEIPGYGWDELDPDDLPPCIAESGGFMNQREWNRWFAHPYQNNRNTRKSHGHLKNTCIQVPPYSTFAVPFAYMLLENQKNLDETLPYQLPEDELAPFDTAWVFGRERQSALLKYYFESPHIKDHQSLVFFYTKEGHPLGESINRLIVGVGRILKVGRLEMYDVNNSGDSYPIWDRLISHSIREDGEDGFLLPYHEYLLPTGDNDEDARRAKLLEEIIVVPDSTHIKSFSYASEHTTSDVALSVLVRCLQAVKKIREHGIANGPWSEREDWLNAQIAKVWSDRGAFPGLGSALEALGMRLGTAMALELLASGRVQSDEDPWPVVESILSGNEKSPQTVYEHDLQIIRPTWMGLSQERKGLLKLLSRFALSPEQCSHWYHSEKRVRITGLLLEDKEILSNPYTIPETDLGNVEHTTVTIAVIDRGIFPDNALLKKNPLPEQSKVESPLDPRRIRAAVVTVLRRAEENGDTLLSASEVLERIANLGLSHPIDISLEMLISTVKQMEEILVTVPVFNDQLHSNGITAIQLREMYEREDMLSKRLLGRAKNSLSSLGVNWATLVRQSIESASGTFDENNKRHLEALIDQSSALEKITTRKLSVLVGRAGTGKTSVLGALLNCDSLKKDGILLLAPTGKARVKLSKSTQKEGMTVAQFLLQLKRYDLLRQKPLFNVTLAEKYRKEKTIVIDECSMLNTDELYALLNGLDLFHVQRIILVGDPNQLPPIGPGRPFADLVSRLENDNEGKYSDALGKLNVEVRSREGDSVSDTLRLASWYTREIQTVDADKVFSDLELGNQFNDLEICFWKDSNELREQILNQMQNQLGLKCKDDIKGFNKVLGLSEVNSGEVTFTNFDGVEYFQILSPVRNHHFGVNELNRWIQTHFRSHEIQRTKFKQATALGDEKIVLADKVIQTKNGGKDGWNWNKNREESVYLANGEIGIVAKDYKGYLNVIFGGRPDVRVGYNHYDFPIGSSGELELAYTLSVHKSQGSEFGVVFFVIPKNCKLLSRELIYTALTRSKQKLVLFIEGDDASILFDYTKPERSSSLNRNTNLFGSVVRATKEVLPYTEYLIHKTEKGHLVRSKSELLIASKLYAKNIDYEYEREFSGQDPGSNKTRTLRPDFSFETVSGDLIIWEHLGMMNKESYKLGWEWKQVWYQHNGYELGKNLFVTMDDENGGLDANGVDHVAEEIKRFINEL